MAMKGLLRNKMSQMKYDYVRCSRNLQVKHLKFSYKWSHTCVHSKTPEDRFCARSPMYNNAANRTAVWTWMPFWEKYGVKCKTLRSVDGANYVRNCAIVISHPFTRSSTSESLKGEWWMKESRDYLQTSNLEKDSQATVTE